jgi:hypothetical protein
VSRFCAKIQLSVIFLEKSSKANFTRRPTEPEDETEWRHEASTHTGGVASPGRAHLVWGRLGRRLDPSFRLHIPLYLKISGRQCFS